MKFSALSLLSVVATAAGLESLTDSVNDIPSCAVSTLKDAMTAEGCSVTKSDSDEFTCLCKHLSAIVVRVVGKIDGPCEADLSTALTNICANWQLYSTTATGYPQATKALGDKLGGSGGSGATSGAASPTSAGSNSQGSSSSKAAAPTAGVGGLVGGAAAVAAYAALL